MALPDPSVKNRGLESSTRSGPLAGVGEGRAEIRGVKRWHGPKLNGVRESRGPQLLPGKHCPLEIFDDSYFLPLFQSLSSSRLCRPAVRKGSAFPAQRAHFLPLRAACPA